MSKRGRKTLYDEKMAEEIRKLLADGCIIADVCAKVGISQDTYFHWVKIHPEFSEIVTRAKAEANLGAVQSLRTAMHPHDVTAKTVKMFKETRLRKVKTKDGVSEVPYEYVKTEQSQTVTNEFDWRAAMEFLKRRDPDNWAESFIIKISPQDKEVLDKHGLKASDAWNQLIQELAVANRASGD